MLIFFLILFQVIPPSQNENNDRNIYGVYKCEAQNIHGSQFINIELEEARK